MIHILADSPQQKGEHFERFIGRLLARLGYQNVNYRVRKPEELDLTAESVAQPGVHCVCECKAHRQDIPLADVAAFFGKFMAARLAEPDLTGFFFTLSALTGDARGFYENLRARDEALARHFRVCDPRDIVGMLILQEGLVPAAAVERQAKVLSAQPAGPTDLVVWAAAPHWVQRFGAGASAGGDLVEEVAVFDAGGRLVPTDAARPIAGAFAPDARLVANQRGGVAPPPRTEAEMLDRYLEVVFQANRYLPIHGLETNLRVPLELDRIYVSLTARAGAMEGRMSKDGIDAGAPAPAPASSPSPAPFAGEPIPFAGAFALAEEHGYHGLVVLGDPGSGKTTALRYAALALTGKAPRDLHVAFKSARLPVLVPLRKVQDFDCPLPVLLCALHATPELPLTPAFFDRLLTRKQCALLLDGLDEVPTAEHRKHVCARIEEFRCAYPGNLFVLSSRFAGYRGDARLPGHYLELQLQDFDEAQVRRFLELWYTEVETRVREDSEHWRAYALRQAADVFDAVRNRPDLKRLATNPLMLQILALVHRDRGLMPETRVRLYAECIDVLLEHWDRAKGIDVPLTVDQARQVLQPLALWMHGVEGRTTAPGEDVRRLLTPYLEKIAGDRARAQDQLDRLLRSVRDRSGLFTGYDVDQYGFQHLSFQEYLAAEQVRNTANFEPLIAHFNESWWREPTLLTVGLGNPSVFEPFMEKLLAAPAFERHTDFVLACVREALVKSAAPFARVVDGRHYGWKTQYNAVLALGELGSGEAQSALTRALKHKNRTVAGAARQALAGLGALQKVAAEARLPVGRSPGALPVQYVHEKDGSELLLVPAGEFFLGSDRAHGDERPRHIVRLNAYFIGRNPVTNAQFERFVKATGYSEWPGGGKRFDAPNQPVVTVSWADARAYCEWAGVRLPTEAEWEKAARGTDDREYPWGNEPPTERLANFGMNVGNTTPIGSYPEGASPYGCLDMAGNVWEWCSSLYRPYRYDAADGREDPTADGARVLRGGAWVSDRMVVRAAYRNDDGPGYRVDFVGFRVVVGAGV
ncbi:MAG: SUMF1/EgtB/PvdO family nonheme iron enzyme [Planctomycetes bacterium]|nr:SUMF1/EgtB/PvdO family nonheme iron enzyme [Planctomycetota bacterium]